MPVLPSGWFGHNGLHYTIVLTKTNSQRCAQSDGARITPQFKPPLVDRLPFCIITGGLTGENEGKSCTRCIRFLLCSSTWHSNRGASPFFLAAPFGQYDGKGSHFLQLISEALASRSQGPALSGVRSAGSALPTSHAPLCPRPRTRQTDYVKACLTFATQLLLITMLFLGIDLSQFGIFRPEPPPTPRPPRVSAGGSGNGSFGPAGWQQRCCILWGWGGGGRR